MKKYWVSIKVNPTSCYGHHNIIFELEWITQTTKKLMIMEPGFMID